MLKFGDRQGCFKEEMDEELLSLSLKELECDTGKPGQILLLVSFLQDVYNKGLDSVVLQKCRL